jgi:hypothetical protein
MMLSKLLKKFLNKKVKSQRKKILFLLNTYNDIDHLTPVIWKVLKEKSQALIIFTSNFNHQNDYRINYLKNQFDLPIIKFPIAYKKSLISKFIREIWYNKYFFYRFLKKNQIDACVYEWGEVPKRNIVGNIFWAAKKSNIPNFCLPHGCSIYLNKAPNKYIKLLYDKTGKGPNFDGRNQYDTYVYQSPYVLKQAIEWGQNSKTTFAWGSARFYPEWAKNNLSICPDFDIKNNAKSKIKVVLMLPHWNYNVFKSKCIQLIEKLVKLSWIHLVIKDHTRGSGGLPIRLRKKYNSMDNVSASVEAHSPALIKWSDIVINFGSSIGIEALIQNKQLIHPNYLHSNKTIFEKTGACHLANSQDDILEYLIDYKNNRLVDITKKNKNKLYQEIIYGGKEKHDTLKKYYNELVRH